MASNYFRLGETDFGVGKVSLSFDKEANVLSLEIAGDQELTHRATENQQGPFAWVLYPPRLYFRAVPCPAATEGARVVLVDEQLLDEYDIALYLLEHNDIQGTLTLSESAATIRFEGTAQLAEGAFALAVCGGYSAR